MALTEELERLAALRDAGKLSEDEFAAAKARLLESMPTAAARSAPQLINTLRRSRRDRWFGGVCGGIARLSGVEAWIWRLLWTVTVFFAGVGLMAYLLCWIFVPDEEDVAA